MKFNPEFPNARLFLWFIFLALLVVLFIKEASGFDLEIDYSILDLIATGFVAFLIGFLLGGFIFAIDVTLAEGK